MAGRGVIVNEVIEEVGRVRCGRGKCRRCCCCGGYSGGSCRHLVGRSGKSDHGRNYYRARDLGSGRRDLRVPGCASDGGTLVGFWGRALLLALALNVGLCGASWAVVPVLEKVVPDTLVMESQGNSLIVQGMGLDVGTVVKWGATSLSTSVYGSTSAVASVPDSLVAAVGVGVVTLENVDGVSNAIGVPVVEPLSKQLDPVLYVVAGLLGAMAFIFGFGTKW